MGVVISEEVLTFGGVGGSMGLACIAGCLGTGAGGGAQLGLAD